jgi:tetratricopeptide (TPR) repeat protein
LSIAYYQKGLCFSKLENNDKAIQYYQYAIKKDSTYSLPFGYLGREYYKIGEFNKCIDYSQKAFQLDKGAIYAMYNVALSNLRLNQFNVAKRQYQLFMKLNAKQGKGIYQGAIDDLKELIDKGILVNESKEILKDVFGVQF